MGQASRSVINGAGWVTITITGAAACLLDLLMRRVESKLAPREWGFMGAATSARLGAKSKPLPREPGICEVGNLSPTRRAVDR